MAEHIVEMAKARVRVTDGRVEVLDDPLIRSCPLREDLYGCQEESRETVAQVLEGHIRDWGMYTSRRILETDSREVSFGASEVMADGMQAGILDAAVVVCEGAGTVVVSNPEVLQAVGAHMTGLLSTEPVKEIQEGLRSRGCHLPDTSARIDQVAGLRLAAELGFKTVAVTVSGEDVSLTGSLKETASKFGIIPVILAVHTTGIPEQAAMLLAGGADLVWACASRWVREVVGTRALLQLGVAIPVYALTPRGKRLLLNRTLAYPRGLVIHRARLPYAGSGREPHPML